MFVDFLTKMIEINRQSISIVEMPEHEIMEFAMTASKRKTAIEEFIKCAFRKTITSQQDRVKFYLNKNWLVKIKIQ